jgi:hypothetical protein
MENEILCGCLDWYCKLLTVSKRTQSEGTLKVHHGKNTSIFPLEDTTYVVQGEDGMDKSYSHSVSPKNNNKTALLR